MPTLSLCVLGSVSASLDDQPVSSFRTRLAQALFIYLACEPQRHPREQLMALFWPELPQASAHQNLRQNLYLLRQAIPEVAAVAGSGTVPLVLADREMLQLNPAAAVTVDARRFAALTGRARPRAADLEEAAALYRGDFLEDFYLADSNPFEEWAAGQREECRSAALLAFERLAALALADEDYATAETYARRQLALDALGESGNRQLIEILARSGRRSTALAHFDDYRRRLYAEHRVQPGPETVALIDAVQGGELPAPGHPPAHVRGYQLHEELGRGKFGVVYRATQPAVGRDVAIKVIPARYADDAGFIRRFEAEAQTIARLEHPQIVPLYDYWREPGTAYLVMRCLRGGPLRNALDTPWEVERAARLLDQLAGALAAAHHQGIVHRDVTPANVLLDEEGNAYLSDFGIARLFQAGAPPTPALGFTGTPEYVSPEQARSEAITPLSDQYSLALVVYEALAGHPPFVAASLVELLDKHLSEPLPALSAARPDLPRSLDGVFGRALAKRAAERYPDVLAFAAAFRAALSGKADLAGAGETRHDAANPYKGLLAFTEADAALFYGRETLTHRLVARLDEADDRHRFLAVVGPSGCGKSSVVRAGLIPVLRGGALPGSSEWFVLDMVPGAHPFEELETALLRIAVNPPASLLAQLQDGERGMLRAVRRTLPADDSCRLLLVIDQFEELFTLVTDRETTSRFLDALYTAVTDPHSPLRVVITLRADFYDRPLLHPGLGDLLRARTEVVVPLGPDELVRAIERPAAQAGVAVEPELVAALAAAVSEQPAALPLLQYTLTELFAGRERDCLTLAAYRRLGGLSGALAQRAEAVYDGLDAAGRTAARALFSRLVTLGEGVEDTRRRVLLAELEALTPRDDGRQTTDDAGAAVGRPWSVVSPLDSFGRARLLAFDRDPLTRGPTVEIAHESLLRAWPRLRGWLDEDRATLRLSRLLTQAAAEWQSAGRDEGFLLRGARLDQLAPLAAGAVALTETERAYLTASLDARQARRAAEEARRQAEIATARKLAETERQRADEQATSAGRLRRRAALLAGVATLAVVLAALALLLGQRASANAELAQANAAAAIQEQQIAEQRALLATSRELSTAALVNLSVDPELSMLLALHALELAETQEADEALHAAIQASRIIQAFDTDATGYDGALLAVSPADVHRLATASETAVTIWDSSTGAKLRELPLSEPVTEHHRLAFSQDGESLTLVSASSERNSVTVRSWHMSDTISEEAQALAITHDEASDIAINPARTLLAVSRQNYTVELWNTTDGKQVATLDGHEEMITNVTFNPSGRLLATVSTDGQVLIWDMAGPLFNSKAPEPAIAFRTAQTPSVTGILVHAKFVNESALALGYLGEVEIWDLADPDSPQVKRFPAALQTRDYALNTSGSLLATAGQDGSAQLWNMDTGELVLVLAQYPSPMDQVSFDTDSSQLTTIDRNGSVRIWDARLMPLGERLSLSVDPGTFDLELSPDERLLALGSVSGPASLWDVATGERLHVLPSGGSAIYRVAFSPDGRHVAGVGQDTRLHVWDVMSGEEILSIAAHEDGVSGGLFRGALDVAYSPDGSQLATAGADGLAKVWDAETGELLLTLAGHTDSLHSLVYSPDGHLIATSSDDEDTTVKVWDARSGALLYSLTGHEERVWGLAFSPDNRFLVTGGARGIIKLWNMETGEEVYTVFDESDHIGSVAFTPNGQWFITTGEVPLRVRRTSDGTVVRTIAKPILWSAKVSKDGRWIYAAAVNGMVQVLALYPEDAIALAYDRLSRWWSPAECQRFLHTAECPPAPERVTAGH